MTNETKQEQVVESLHEIITSTEATIDVLQTDIGGEAEQAIRAVGTDAVFLALLHHIEESLPEDVLGELVERSNNKGHEAKLTQLYEKKDELVELGVGTTDIDKAIEAVALEVDLHQLSSAEENVLGYVALFGLSGDGDQEVPTQTKEATIEDLPEIPLSFDNEADKTFMTIAKRRIPLSGVRYESQTDYTPERFAAIAVLSELTPGEELLVDDFRERVAATLGVEADGVSDRAVGQVRAFLEKITYRKQKVFYHNALRGKASAYGVNPDLNYDIILDGFESDQEVNLFAEQLLRQREENALSGKTKDSTQTKQEMFDEYEPYRDLLPSVSEIQTLLTKIREFAHPSVLSQIDLNNHPAFEWFLEFTSETLDCIERDYDEEHFDAIKDTITTRDDTYEQLLNLVTDKDLLDRYFDLPEEFVFEEYGEDLTENINALVESLLEMSDDEKELLSNMVRARIVFDPLFSAGSFSSGKHYQGSEPTTNLVIPTSMRAKRKPETPTFTISEEEPIVNEPTSISSRIEETPSSPIKDESKNYGIEIPQVDDIEEADTAESELQEPEQDSEGDDSRDALVEPQEQPKSKKEQVLEELRQHVGSMLNEFETDGRIHPGGAYNSGSLAHRGIRSSDVKNAVENGHISRNRDYLTFEDTVILLTINDVKFAQHMDNPKLRKSIRKEISRIVRVYEGSLES